MTPAFQLDHRLLAQDERFLDFANDLSVFLRLDSSASFNTYCREACRLWQHAFPEGLEAHSAKFSELLDDIARGGLGVIPTTWGGVVVTLHQHPQVEKFLVVRQGGYLALEKHEQKDERLEVQAGAGLLLSRRSSDLPLSVQALAPGDQFHFEPGMEHCLIGTENLLVFERSTDPKGMDQDLIFIYEPDGK